VANWLHEQFVSRGYDTYTKITGSDAQVRYNDTVSEIEREQQVRLYENERELARFDSIDVAIVENQGIRPYTTHGWSTSSSSTPIWCFSPMSGRTTSTR